MSQKGNSEAPPPLRNVPLDAPSVKVVPTRGADTGDADDGAVPAPLSAEALHTQRWRIASAVGFYMCVSISLVFANKYVLSSSKVDLEAPLALTWTQLVVAVVVCYVVSAVRNGKEKKKILKY